MKKIALFLLATCAIVASCQKTVKVPLDYTVETAQNKPLEDIYIPHKGTYRWSLLVKYLGGYTEDKVTISVSGMPKDVRVGEDTISKVPTFRADFDFITDSAKEGVYPITVTTSAIGSSAKTYTTNLHVIPADCAVDVVGNYNASNACTSRNVTYTSSVAATGTANEITISNLGGYGTSTVTRVKINCEKDSLYISNQNIGNGAWLSGSGKINGNTLTIYYEAISTPQGFPETCIATLTRQ